MTSLGEAGIYTATGVSRTLRLRLLKPGRSLTPIQQQYNSFTVKESAECESSLIWPVWNNPLWSPKCRNSLFWQRRPSGKQSLPVPSSSSRPQSSGKSGSCPVATGALVPSSVKVGPIPSMFCTPRTKGCKTGYTRPSAWGRAPGWRSGWAGKIHGSRWRQ